ncbi:hypothetical protein NC651_034260 [Populus alba x Populus x berolinensis]|nr:hypothetical protein NC651_034260 [Populus alba x Populus x berolinensis]
MAASQAALLLHRFFLEKVSGPRWEALDRREKPASSDASHINPFIQLDKLPSNMVQAKDSELYKPVLMESYTSPGGIDNTPIQGFKPFGSSVLEHHIPRNEVRRYDSSLHSKADCRSFRIIGNTSWSKGRWCARKRVTVTGLQGVYD